MGQAALQRLVAKIESALQRMGLEAETRKFTPHVTLARLRDAPLPKIREKFHITEELLYRARKCEQCANNGYKGRLGVYEVMTFDRDTRNEIAKGSPAHVIKDRAIAGGMSTLWDEGLKKVRAGLTSLEELESAVLLER